MVAFWFAAGVAFVAAVVYLGAGVQCGHVEVKALAGQAWE